MNKSIYRLISIIVMVMLTLTTGVPIQREYAVSENWSQLCIIGERYKFAQWIDGLQDIRARARILVQIERLKAGNPGDVKPVGEGISELRIDYGPGYRVYFVRRSTQLVILLAGGDKRSQRKDIQTALELARRMGDEHD